VDAEVAGVVAVRRRRERPRLDVLPRPLAQCQAPRRGTARLRWTPLVAIDEPLLFDEPGLRGELVPERTRVRLTIWPEVPRAIARDLLGPCVAARLDVAERPVT